MQIVRAILGKIADMFGFKRSSKYVKTYLNNANMKSGIYMAGIIFILEFWLVLRQHNKYIIPKVAGGQEYWRTMFDYTSNFWLLMFVGLAMMLYCIFYLDKHKKRWKAILVMVVAGIGVAISCLLPLEKTIMVVNLSTFKNVTAFALLIVTYVLSFIFQLTLLVSTFLVYKNKTSEIFSSIVIISIFASVCILFGFKVSFSDFFSTSDIKQIICFLMMSMYVACLLIWKPYISVTLLGIIFYGFNALLEACSNSGTGLRTVPDGDVVNYLTFYISLCMIAIAIYNQRVAEARKDEELEVLATKDVLTDLYSYEYFITLCQKKFKELGEEKTWVCLYVDTTNFKMFNDQKGFVEGNKFLKDVGQIMVEEMPKEAYVSRQSDDHFAIFTPNNDLDNIIHKIENRVNDLDNDIRPGIIVGGYVSLIEDEDVRRAFDKARYACASIKHKVGKKYALYDEEMHKKYHLVQYIVRHIDEAIANGYIKAYYQPVVYAKNKELCGAEALTRWIDPKYGFMNPGIFISVLEDAQLINKLDVAMLRIVCNDIKERMDTNKPVIPVSINFSRIDFMVMDVPSIVEEIIHEYDIPKEYIHVEITESALMDNAALLKEEIVNLKEKGFAIWLDDFGVVILPLTSLKTMISMS